MWASQTGLVVVFFFFNICQHNCHIVLFLSFCALLQGVVFFFRLGTESVGIALLVVSLLLLVGGLVLVILICTGVCGKKTTVQPATTTVCTVQPLFTEAVKPISWYGKGKMGIKLKGKINECKWGTILLLQFSHIYTLTFS